MTFLRRHSHTRMVAEVTVYRAGAQLTLPTDVALWLFIHASSHVSKRLSPTPPKGISTHLHGLQLGLYHASRLGTLRKL
jgi:hypothetical protein